MNKTGQIEQLAARILNANTTNEAIPVIRTLLGLHRTRAYEVAAEIRGTQRARKTLAEATQALQNQLCVPQAADLEAFTALWHASWGAPAIIKLAMPLTTATILQYQGAAVQAGLQLLSASYLKSRRQDQPKIPDDCCARIRQVPIGTTRTVMVLTQLATLNTTYKTPLQQKNEQLNELIKQRDLKQKTDMRKWTPEKWNSEKKYTLHQLRRYMQDRHKIRFTGREYTKERRQIEKGLIVVQKPENEIKTIQRFTHAAPGHQVFILENTDATAQLRQLCEDAKFLESRIQFETHELCTAPLIRHPVLQISYFPYLPRVGS